MAACESLPHIFDNTLSESPPAPLLDSLLADRSSHRSPPFTDIFGELHFQEHSPRPDPSPSSSSSLPVTTRTMTTRTTENENSTAEGKTESDKSESTSPLSSWITGMSSRGEHHHGHHRSSESFSSMNSDSLLLCTEGLGFESCDDVEDSTSNESDETSGKLIRCKSESAYSGACRESRSYSYSFGASYNYNAGRPQGRVGHEFRRSKSIGSHAFPPPIPSVSVSTGKPWVCFKSYRDKGRFVLKEIRFPTREFLHAKREGGRLRLHFVQPSNDDDIDEGGEEEDDRVMDGEGARKNLENGEEEEEEEEEEDDDEEDEEEEEVERPQNQEPGTEACRVSDVNGDS